MARAVTVRLTIKFRGELRGELQQPIKHLTTISHDPGLYKGLYPLQGFFLLLDIFILQRTLLYHRCTSSLVYSLRQDPVRAEILYVHIACH